MEAKPLKSTLPTKDIITLKEQNMIATKQTMLKKNQMIKQKIGNKGLVGGPSKKIDKKQNIMTSKDEIGSGGDRKNCFSKQEG